MDEAAHHLFELLPCHLPVNLEVELFQDGYVGFFRDIYAQLFLEFKSA